MAEIVIRGEKNEQRKKEKIEKTGDDPSFL
jgi:hypothetical protein